ncbi:MAG TPA: YitT family protein, partial [Segetibacter sp.]|nr:YitT family protein [Segetibacter sp.]
MIANSIDFKSLQEDVFQRLENRLPSCLTYHNAAHTKAVLASAQTLAAAEELNDEDTLLISTAALFHDTGFLKTYKNHEAASCVIARELLPNYGCSSLFIEKVCGLIMVTKSPQRPSTKLEGLLCDADLHYIGTPAYAGTADKLYIEFKKEGLVSGRKEWLQKQVSFLMAHRFFTASAQALYGPLKETHLKELTHAHHRQQHFATYVQDIFFLVLGVLIAGFALKGFLVPNHFFDGGVTGLSLLLHELYHFNLAYVIVALNLPLILVGYFTVSRSFAYKTLAAVILLGLCLLFMPYPAITSDKLLISIFGGVFLGIGIGLTMKAGCALDGVEVLALYTLKKTSFTITEIILGINILIFTIAAFKFGVETALYSVLTYFVASRMIDYVIEGLQAYTGVTIISGESELLKYRLVNEMGRAITVYKGERGFLPGKFDQSAE